jgi:hypothetical protein
MKVHDLIEAIEHRDLTPTEMREVQKILEWVQREEDEQEGSDFTLMADMALIGLLIIAFGIGLIIGIVI